MVQFDRFLKIDYLSMYSLLLVIHLLFFTISYAESGNFENLNILKIKTPPDVQRSAALDILNRIVPEKFYLFNVLIDEELLKDGKDTFSIRKRGGIIEITANNGVTATWGFYYYLKNYCGCHIGWQIKQVTLPDFLPKVDITITAKDRFRYYQNVCTTSYSFAWWNMNDWRHHIDWMALNGINMALASHGQETIWSRVYTSLNLTEEEIREHFSGPAFLSWQRMGNIRGWGGPLNSTWLSHSFTLQHFIVKTMTDLGMIPILPAFAGHVPRAFKRLFPNASMTEVEPWNDFQSEYCCPLFLEPTDPLFLTVGKMFLTEITKEFGMFHIYNSDPFNENKPTSSDVGFLKSVGAAIHRSMTIVDPEAIWMLQSWMFMHEVYYWTRDRVEELLTSVKGGHILILDLQSEQWPQYNRFKMFYGQPFIWCMLHDFGGTLGMFGDTQSINSDVYTARSSINSTMVGVGLTPEGINQNYVMYELMLESSLRDSPLNLTLWSEQYCTRRYGMKDDDSIKAWDYFMKSVYDFRGLNKMRGKYIITRRPNLDIKPWSWYNSSDLLEGWKYLLNAHTRLNSSKGYRHDLVDVTRQVLQYRGDQIYSLVIEAFNNKDLTALENYSDTFMDIFEDLQEILASNNDFLLGNWLEAAKSLAITEEDLSQFEYNARNQITLWGPNGEIFDYANKQWAGMVEDYYSMRWRAFLSAMYNSVKNNYKFNKTSVLNAIFAIVEKPFTLSNKVYPIFEIGDTVDVALNIYSKWYVHDNLPDVPIGVIPKKIVESNEDSYKNTLHRQQRGVEDFDNNDVQEFPIHSVNYQVIMTP